MEKRAAIPPGLPRANPTVSYWQDPPDAISDLCSTQPLPEAADIVIIGSGISGACVGYNILEHLPAGKVVMLEARQACSGATGRNGQSLGSYDIVVSVIVPLRGHITAHRPGSGMPTGGLPTTYSFIYDNGYEYMIPRPPGSKFAGDIVIGGGLTKAVEEGLYEYGTTDDTTTDPRIIDYLKETTITYFGDNWGEDNKKGRIRQEWSGIMGYSADGFPLIGHIPGEEGLSIAASFQGHGMVLCFLCAKALTEILLGADDKQLDPWFPRAFRMRKERLQKKFEGRLHVKAAKELEVKSQLRKAAGHAKPAS